MENSGSNQFQRQEAECYNNDPLLLQASDHPGTQIVNLKLNGVNFQKWSRSVKIALRTKVKLGFIDRTCPRPSTDSPKFDQWIKCDSVVVSWLLNSMTPDLSEAFLYVNSSKELWDELVERFGESNGPLLYQLEKEISELFQGNDSVAVYYTKLKKLWDEKSDLLDVPNCTCPETCPSIKKSAALDQRQKLMQFLMHLNDEYDAIRGQILLSEPLPTVNKAYSMIQRIERQRYVTNNAIPSREIAAFVHKGGQPTNTEVESANALVAKGFNNAARKDARRTRNNKVCDHCQKPGRTREQCFQLVGCPEWYEAIKGKRKHREGQEWLLMSLIMFQDMRVLWMLILSARMA